MRLGRTARAAAVLTGIPIVVAGLGTGVASAHGTMGNPISRIAACYEEGPESPKSDVCKRLVEENGTQPLYDWNEVNIPDAAGKHREIIPDGELCSAGRDKYSGLDNPGEWRTTNLPASGEFTFEYTATAPHKGTFELYVTKDGWDPSKPLSWSDLESEPFLTVKDPKVVNGSYELTGQLPEGKSGRHLVYAIWQRSDSPEAFYSCSDVTFGEEGAASGAEAGADRAEDGSGGQAGTNAELVSGGDDHSTGSGGDTARQDGRGGDHAAPAAAEENALPLTGSALTGLFLAAFAAMAGGTTLVWFARRRRRAGAHRS